LMGLAFGYSRKELGIDDEMISSSATLEKCLEVEA
jgi:heterodisulfide reductase subunit B